LSWKSTPHFFIPGRTAWEILDKPIKIAGDDLEYKALRCKGIGVWNPKKGFRIPELHRLKTYEIPSPPTCELYNPGIARKHFGFSKNGDFKFITSSPSPFGGIGHDRALQEYTNALYLYNHGVSVTPPMLVAEYSDLFFKKKSMGVVVTLSRTTIPFRLNKILGQLDKYNPNYHIYYQNLIDNLEISRSLDPALQRIEILNILMTKIGDELRKFSSCGVYRHSGGLDNFFYCFKSKKVIFTDLDSSRLLNELPKVVQPLEILRDLISVMHKFLHVLTFQIEKSLYKIHDFKESDPLYSLMLGYFGSNFDTDVKVVSPILWKYFSATSLDTWRRQNFSEEKDVFYIFCLIALMPIYKKSKLNKKYESHWNQDDLLKKAQILSKERYKMLEILLEQV